MTIFKFAGIVTWRQKRHRVRFALRRTDWRKYLRRSWRKRRFWFWRAPRQIQLMALVVEWRFYNGQ